MLKRLAVLVLMTAAAAEGQRPQGKPGVVPDKTDPDKGGASLNTPPPTQAFGSVIIRP